VPGNGNYVVGFLDTFACPIPLLIIALFECIAVAYVYGIKNIADDIELMTGNRPGLYWQFCWKYLSPGVMFTVFAACLIKMFLKIPTYEIWFFGRDDSGLMRAEPASDIPYPIWALVVAGIVILIALLWIPFVAVGIIKMKKEEQPDFPKQNLKDERQIQPHIPSDFERKFLWRSADYQPNPICDL